MKNYLIMVYNFSQWMWVYDFQNKKWNKFNWGNNISPKQFQEIAEKYNMFYFSAKDVEESYSKFDKDEIEFMGFDDPNWKEKVRIISYVG